MNNEHWKWARDWACIGATTSAVSPLIAGTMIPLELTSYALVAGVLGAVSGAFVGWGLAVASSVVPKRSWVSMAAVIAPVPLGAWGGLVATTAAWITQPSMVPLALACGTVAALAQTLWLAPLYVWLVRRGWLRFPLVVGSALVSPFSGVLGMVAGLVALDAIQYLHTIV